MKYVELSRRPANGKSFFGPFSSSQQGDWFGFGGAEKVFDDLLRGIGATAPRAKEEAFAFTPRIDVEETEKAIVVKAELAGVDEKDVEVTLDEDRLVIKGEKKRDTDAVKGEQLYRERNYGNFKREFILQSEVERDQVTAKYRNGVLEVTLPKTPAAHSEARKIAINA